METLIVTDEGTPLTESGAHSLFARLKRAMVFSDCTHIFSGIAGPRIIVGLVVGIFWTSNNEADGGIWRWCAATLIFGLRPSGSGNRHRSIA